MARPGPGALLVVVLASATLAAQPPRTPAPRGQHGTRLFPPQDLGLLEAPDRDEWQKPHLVLDALGIAEASVVADFGAGAGWFTVRLARRVGPNGKVYAQDVQQEMLAAITRRVAREGLSNVESVLGQANDPMLPVGRLDAVLTVDVLHEIDDRVTLLASLARALKPNGRLGVVDFLPGGGGPGPDAGERVAPDVIEAEAARAGLVLQRRETFLPFQYFLIFGRADPTTGASTRRPGR
jgi:ubiquinone/menaquinone biosynthesis C-methylase UbiE